MNLKICILAVLLISFSAKAYSQNFTGRWLVEKKDGVIEIYKKGNKYYGKVVKAKTFKDKNGKLKRDVKNPDKSKRNRTLKDLVFLTDFTLKDKQLVGGKLYDSRSGKTYKGKLWIENGKMKVRGYLGVFYDTRTWTRTK